MLRLTLDQEGLLFRVDCMRLVRIGRIWYNMDCACLNLSSFNRLASPSRIWICYKCCSKNFSHFPFHYSQLYLTVSNFFGPLSDTNFTFELDSFSSTTPFAPRIHSTPILNCLISLEPPAQNMNSTATQANPIHSTPILNCLISLEPPAQNMNSTATQANPPPAFSISSSRPESPLRY